MEGVPLQQYCREKRLVVLESSSSAFEAARALEGNRIGTVVVQDAGQVVGIVTDRDLAVRVTGSGADPMETRLSEVMTPEPVTLSPTDSEEQAIEVMRDQHVRRVPIKGEDGVAGIVTLDDLILAGKVDTTKAAQIVEAQRVEAAPAKPAGTTPPARASGGATQPETRQRHVSRSEQTMHQFEERLLRDLGLTDRAQALAVFDIVAAGLVRRLTPAEAQHVAAQLPSQIREKLLDLRAGPDTRVTRESITREIVSRMNVAPEYAVRLLENVATSLVHFVSAGELEGVIGQLPGDLRELFPRSP